MPLDIACVGVLVGGEEVLHAHPEQGGQRDRPVGPGTERPLRRLLIWLTDIPTASAISRSVYGLPKSAG
ncbi:hypothetical protein SAZ11_51275 [Streptomyces sp. FXJ1.4098]|nr:hypothetical protein [Streptomyces sp. FXJ1.4098]